MDVKGIAARVSIFISSLHVESTIFQLLEPQDDKVQVIPF